MGCPYRLEPDGRHQHQENARLRELGTAVRVELPDGVTAWAITRLDAMQELLGDPRVAKGVDHWSAWRRGEIPPGWPLIDFVAVRSMITADGETHRRQRSLVAQGFTPRRVERLRPRIRQVVDALLDEVAAAGPGPLDLRQVFAHRLPMTVICELIGVPAERREELRGHVVSLTSSTTDHEETLTNQKAVYALLGELVDAKRRTPADDLTTALIAAHEADGDRLSGEELVGTLLLMLVAGHTTTANLITNAVVALLSHPDQLALVRAGTVSWAEAIEEVLRWNGPVNQFPMRYATEDIDVDGTVIPRGDAILTSIAAAGRDPAAHGPDADVFDVTRPAPRHLAFSHGVHYCVGAPLARMETQIALEALFDRFPGLALAEPADRLVPQPSLVSNGVRTLPVTV